MESGILPIKPDSRDYSLLHTFGATPFDSQGLPDNFSIYDGRPIPNQDQPDTRFNPAIKPLPFGCTAECLTFASGIEDGKDALYSPLYTYLATPPYLEGQGRDIRAAMKTCINIGLQSPNGWVGNKRSAYFNVYGTGPIDDFDAARIALWINQAEARSVIVGTWWYWYGTDGNDCLQTPDFITSGASLHCYAITGWKTINGVLYHEAIPWLGMNWGDKGKCYISREIYNKLMTQPYTGAFTISKVGNNQPVPIGMQAYYDHIVYAFVQFIRNVYSK